MGKTKYMNWTHRQPFPILRRKEVSIKTDEVLESEILGYGGYLCLRWSLDAGRAAAAPIDALAHRLGLRNEFEPGDAPPAEAIAFLRRQTTIPADIADEGLLRADGVVHVSSQRPEVIAELSAAVTRAIAPVGQLYVLQGVRRPPSYTGRAMTKWAYERQVVQQPGPAMPNAFLVPMSKTAEWWRKDWMERHTYFLPTYDDGGRMRSQGHALASEAGIA